MKKKKCKLMFFVYILGQGGAERVILNILNHINRSKYEIHLTLGEKDGNEYLPFLKDKDKIQIHYLNIPLGNNVDASSKLAEYVDKYDIDILFTEAYYTNTLAYHASKKAKKKVHLIFREATSRSKTNLHSYKNVIKTFYRYNFCADKVIAISDGVRRDLQRKYFVLGNKIVRIYNPIDMNEITKKSLEKIENKEFLKIEGKKIVHVGRLSLAKDQKVLLSAFKLLNEEYNETVSLIILGKGELEGELKAYCKDNKIQNVHFLGFQNNPHKYVKNSDVFVLSSKSEGFGNVITEALAVGTPVISTNCMSGPKEILKNGKCGLLVDVGDIKQLSLSMKKLLSNSKLREKLVKEGRKEVRNYKVQNIVQQYEKVIDSVALKVKR